MTNSTYNLYLLINTKNRAFELISIQTNDILIFRTKEFYKIKDLELKKTNLFIKPKDILLSAKQLIFNRYILIQKNDII